MRFASVCACMCAVLAVATCTDLDTLKFRVTSSLWNYSPEQVESAIGFSSALLPNGSWPDIDYKDTSAVIWAPYQHLVRTQVMASVVYPGCPQAKNATLINSIHSALDFWFKLNAFSTNWWWNELTAPRTMAEIMLLFTYNTTAAELQGANIIMNRAIWKGWTGANLVDMVMTQIYQGLLLGNSTAVSYGLDVVWYDLYFAQRDNTTQPLGNVNAYPWPPGNSTGDPSDGVQFDYSYHQHGPQSLAGSYGAVYTSDILQLINYTTGLEYYIPMSNLEVFAGLVLDGQQWMTINQVFDWAVCGRQNTNPSPGGYGVGFDAELLEIIPYRQSEFQQYAKQLQGGTVPPLVGNKHYYCSDYMVHRRANYVASVHMYSTRIIPARCVNEQGKLSEHYGDGLNYLYYTGDEYRDVFGVWNWQQLPGITCEQNPDLQLPCSYTFPLNASSFVGGVSDGMYGACGMELVSHNLTSQKGYLFFDSAYVAANSKIVCNSNNPVYTTVANVVMSSNVTVQVGADISVYPSGNFTIAPQWIHHGGTGYIFLDTPAPTVYLHVGLLYGNWINCGVLNQSLSLNTVSILIDNTLPHGVAQSAYIVVPNVTAEAMPAIYSEKAGLRVQYTSEVHAALNVSTDSNTGMLQALFWDPANVTFDDSSMTGWSVAVTEPCMLIVDVQDTGDVTITISNPDTPNLAVDVYINRLLTGTGCTNPVVGQNVTLFSFVLPTFFGNSTSMTCHTASPLLD